MWLYDAKWTSFSVLMYDHMCGCLHHILKHWQGQERNLKIHGWGCDRGFDIATIDESIIINDKEFQNIAVKLEPP